MNYIEHKAKQIIGLYGDKEHRGRCQCLGGKRCLNHVFNAMGLCYADHDGPSMSLPVEDAAPHGRRTGSRRCRGRKAMVWRGANTVVLESCKRKRSDRGWGLAESADIQIGREIAGKVGNSKRVVIE